MYNSGNVYGNTHSYFYFFRITLEETTEIMEISKANWKLYRERVSDWQEHYMEQLTKEYVELLTSPGNASDHFWKLEKRIKQDKKYLGVLIELRKSTALWDIAYFVRDKVITMKDLEGFSEDLIDAVKLILSR